MKKVLYLTNIEVPYRVRFFNELAKYCDLTVLYERERSANRNQAWAGSVQRNFQVKYLKGFKVGNENAFSLEILKEVFSKYDRIIVGCYNSPVQMMAILTMRLFRIPYILNLDGEPFLSGEGIKKKLKRFFVSGADKYLVAGEKAAESLRDAIGIDKVIIPYYFSSLTEQEIEEHRQASGKNRNKTILVVGQYYDYKGMDVALEAACMDLSLRYKFVGMGNRTDLFQAEHEIPENIEGIPFLQKQELEEAYKSCAMLVLPSRQECWGLVVNEAASFGMPIVSTWGSGAAVEFLAEKYPQNLAEPGNVQSLYECIVREKQMQENMEYSQYLLEKSRQYSIEENVRRHIQAMQLLSATEKE